MIMRSWTSAAIHFGKPGRAMAMPVVRPESKDIVGSSTSTGASSNVTLQPGNSVSLSNGGIVAINPSANGIGRLARIRMKVENMSDIAHKLDLNVRTLWPET